MILHVQLGLLNSVLGTRAVVGGSLLARSVSQLAVLVLEDVMLLHAEVPPVVHDVQGG